MRFEFPHDPSAIHLKTRFPSENHLQAIVKGETTQRFVNCKQSKGNYFVDTEGNTILDLNASASGQVLGYNHDDLINARDSDLYDRFVTHKADLNSLPPNDIADLIRDNVMPSAPNGLYQVHLGGGSTGGEANELAMSAALRSYARQNRKELSDLFVLGFDNSHHGDSTACLSVSSPDANPNRLPAFPWPRASFPQLQYPYADFEQQNIAEEDRCIQEFERIITSNGDWGSAGAVIVEPISTLGNHIATPRFFRRIRQIARNNGVPFIVDESKTGVGASGKNWAHDYWYLHDDEVPDFVTFGGKSGLSGFYSTLDHRLNSEATSFQQ